MLMYHNLLLISLILSPSLIWIASATSLSEMDRLVSNLTSSYNKNFRPPLNTSETLIVQTSFFIMALVNYDEVSGILTLTGGPMMTWKDPRLVWTPADYSDINLVVMPRSTIWNPPIFVLNTAEDLESIDDPGFLVRFTSTGVVASGIGGDMKVLCPSDMTYFPFDTQKCMIRLGTWGYFGNEVYLKKIADTVSTDYFSENNIWSLDSSSVEEQTGSFKGVLEFKITMRRKPLYVCVKMIAPIMFLVFLNPLVFLLPVESGERISFSVTILLAIGVFMSLISSSLPQSSSPMALLIYFLFIYIVLSSLSTVVVMLNTRRHLSDPAEKAPKTAVIIVSAFGFRCCRKCIRGKNEVKNVKVGEMCTGSKIVLTDEVEETKGDISCQSLAKEIDKLAFLYITSVNCLIFFLAIITYAVAP